MNVISLYFALWVTIDKKGEDILYGLSLSISMLLAAALEPIMGAVSDAHKTKKPFLIFFTVLCCIFTGFMGMSKGLFWGLVFFVIANFGYQLAGVFYNSLLLDISNQKDLGRISGYGVALGYLGTIAGLLLVRPFVLRMGRQAAFIPTALLFFLFSLPCFLFVKEKKTKESFSMLRLKFPEAFQRIRDTFVDSKKYPHLIKFLLAAFIFLNAVNTTIIFMSVYTKKVLGFTDEQLVSFYIFSTIFAILGSFYSGLLVDRIGARKSVNISLGFWIAGLLIAFISWNKLIFWAVGPLIGIALGSLWVSSRALAIKLCPSEKLSEIFGLFGLAGKSSSIVGPLIWGLTVLGFGFLGLLKYRIAIFIQLIFIFVGWQTLRSLVFSDKRC